MRKIGIGGERGAGKYALVDDDDYEMLAQYAWNLSPKGYVRTTVMLETRAEAREAGRKARKTKHLFMHRLVMGLGSWRESPIQVDHVSRDKLDNRKVNLRLASNADNQVNSSKRGTTSRFKNVSWVARDQKWQVQGNLNGRKVALGHYDDEEEAGRVALEWRKANLPFATD